MGQKVKKLGSRDAYEPPGLVQKCENVWLEKYAGRQKQMSRPTEFQLCAKNMFALGPGWTQKWHSLGLDKTLNKWSIWGLAKVWRSDKLPKIVIRKTAPILLAVSE